MDNPCIWETIAIHGKSKINWIFWCTIEFISQVLSMNTLIKDVGHVMGKIVTFGRNSWFITMPWIILAIIEANAITSAQFIFTGQESGQSK